MSHASILDKAIEVTEKGREALTESEEVYIEFRRVVDPGMVDAGFDIIPSKSSDLTQKSSGEKFTDQTLRGHILNGAAFGTQFNDILTEIDPGSALDREDFLKALALFACHDFHKTDAPQKRRLERERGLSDEDKDLRDEEVHELDESLNLDDLDTALGFRDYYASALSAEKMSGRHNQVASKEFDRLREWVRLMDAAAGLQTPMEARSLEKRVREVSDNVNLHYHRVDDVRGVSTNILNHAVSEHLTDQTRVKEVVHFHNGALYVSDDEKALIEPQKENYIPDDSLDDILQRFIGSVKQSRKEFQKPRELQGFLNTAGVLPKGYLKINSTSYFLSGVENILGAVREYLQGRSNQDNWSVYSVYSDALTAAVAWDLIDEIPRTHNKTQALGIYAGTVFMELFRPLNGGDARDSIADLCDALELDSAKNELLAEYDADDPLFLVESISESDVEQISDSTGIGPNDVRNNAESVDLHGGGNKSFAQVAVMAFLNGTTTEGLPRDGLPIEELLLDMEDMFLSYYRDWEQKWDENRGKDWDEDWNNERKTEMFELELQGVLPEASEHYIRSNVEIDGYWFKQSESKDKYNEYTKKSQGHVCLLCNDLLIGDTSLSSFESGQDTVGKSLGFSHMKKIDAGGGEPSGVICPVCNLEMTLRNSVHETDPDTNSQYLVVAPDYFYSPIDIEIERQLRDEIYEGGGGDLLRTAQSLIGSDPSKRSEAMDSILEILKQTEEQEDFQNRIKNYDTGFNVKGVLGIYRLDPPRRANDPNKKITRVPRWYLASYFSVLFSWLTSSRALLTDTPIPTTGFNDYNEMVQIEGAPPPVQRFVGETVTISRLGTGDEWWEYEFSHLMKGSEDKNSREVETTEKDLPEGQVTLTQHTDKHTEIKDDTTTRYELRVNTGLAESLYKLSAFTYVGFRAHDFDVQRFASLLSDLQEPFVGANSLLKGDEQIGDYTALRAADILDTLIHQNMSNRLAELAEAGFEAARPNPDEDSNHEYERLFRVARDAIADGVTKNASRDEMVEMVAGDVMKAAARARSKNARGSEDKKYASERYTREPAEEFARIFIDDVFEDMCDGEFYELRRLENKLASGYNAAIRRHLQEWFDEHSD